MSNYDTITGFSMPLHLDPSWTDEINFNWAAIGKFIAPDDCYFVSPGFTTGNLFQAGVPSDRRHFDTVQGAINAKTGTGAVWNDSDIIVVLPGEYQENIVITKNISLVSPYPLIRDTIGGGYHTKITGSLTGANPLVTVVPFGDAEMSVNITNIAFSNRYNADNAVEITDPYFLKISKPLPLTARVYFGLKGCVVFGQTFGRHNTWSSLVDVDGFGRIVFRDTDIELGNFSGGDYDGGIRTAIKLRGDYLNSQSMEFGGKNVNIEHQFSGSGTPYTFDIDDGVTGSIGRSQFPPDSRIDLLNAGTNGTNTMLGASGATIAEYNNLQGVNLSWF